MLEALKYYGSLIFAAHGKSKRWWSIGATWAGYGVALMSALPAIEVAVPALQATAAGPVRWGVLAGVFFLSLAGENWRRVRALQAERKLLVAVNEVGWRSDDHVRVFVDVSNRGDTAMGLQSTWVLAVYVEEGGVPTVFDGASDLPVPLILPNQVVPIVVRMPVGKGWWRHWQPVNGTLSAFDAHGRQMMQYLKFRRYDGESSVYP